VKEQSTAAPLTLVPWVAKLLAAPPKELRQSIAPINCIFSADNALSVASVNES